MKIITPAFNGYGKYLPELIKSVENQIVKPKEVIIVLGKDHQMPEIKTEVPLRLVKTELDCLGKMINEGMKYVDKDELVLCFNADDVLLPNAVEEIQKVDADLITLKYKWQGTKCYETGIYSTPKIEIEKIKNWKKYYIGPSGYLAFKKDNVVNSDFWQWALLWRYESAGKKIRETKNACAEWLIRPNSHGSGNNLEQAVEFLNKEAEKYTSNPKLSVFSVVYNEESMCREAWESVKGVDELVICIDDRTNDKTEEIAKEFTDKIYRFKWKDDFAEAKNFAVSKCTGDWFFGIDGDCALKTPIDKIRHAIKETECEMIDMTLYPIGRDWQTHLLPKVFKKGVTYKGQAHEFPVGGKRDFKDYGIKLEYDYSPNHSKDPDRYIRILSKALKQEPESTRWQFYLAREYFYKKEWKKAIEMYNEYIEKATFLAEKADAYLTLARCYWIEKQGDKARDCNLKAIEINPNFKEALLFMSEIVWARHSQRWVDFAQHADNSEVLFIR